MFEILKTLVGVGAGAWSRRSERKNKIKEAVAEAEIERLRVTSDPRGWKDEYLVVIWTLPAIMVFVPWLQPYALEGFKVLENNTPDWYVYGLLSITGAVFGLKSLINWRRANGHTKP